MRGGRRFPLYAVLYVNTGGIPGIVDGHGLVVVQELLSHMTGHQIFLHQIPRAVDICQKYLRDQYGWLAKMQPTEAQSGDVLKLRRWLNACEKERGDSLVVAAMPGDAFHYIEPVQEFLHQLAEGRGVHAAAGAADDGA